MNAPYTAAEDQMIIDLLAKGFSANRIATVLGRTRNSICGRLHRKGMLQSSRAKPKPPARHPFEKPGPKKHVPQANPWARPKERGKPQPPESLPQEPPPPRGSVTLVQLKPWQCRWPYGDPRDESFRFCGQQVWHKDAPYCAAHTREAWRRSDVGPPELDKGSQ